ncbi:hypothetical protein QTP88_004287 [Uroleucon formosanum]
MSDKNQKSLTHFFKITPTNDDNLKSSDMANSSHVNEKEKLSTNKRSASQLSNYVSTNPNKIHLDSPALISTSPFDISFCKNKKLDQNDIINVLNNLWKPDVQFNFPTKTYICGKENKEKNLKFQYSWLVRYSWLAYSVVVNGAFLLADETSDISGMEQVSLCVRYVDLDKLELREDFLQFIPTNNTTGKGLANLILENLSTFGVELKCLLGQGYDGAAAMSGRYKGVQVHIKIYDISIWEDSDTSGKAQCLRSSILNGEFIISLIVLTKGFGFGLPLSKQLQKINRDLRLAVKLAHETYQEVQVYRNDAENKFEKFCKEASKIADNFEVVIKIPKTSNRQTLRVNINTTSAEEYYRVSVFIPYLESFANELKERFIDHETTLNSFHSLFSKEELDDDFMTLVNYYQDDLENGNHAILMAEYKLWQRCLKNLSEEPTNALQALSFCNNEIYPNIYKLLQILATLPVSTSSNERTFSNLKRIKIYLKNTIGEVTGFSVEKKIKNYTYEDFFKCLRDEGPLKPQSIESRLFVLNLLKNKNNGEHWDSMYEKLVMEKNRSFAVILTRLWAKSVRKLSNLYKNNKQ